jgi:flavorubredoxin
MHISDTIYCIGVNDHETDLFESQYPLENGMAYNSYVILDEKIAVMDTVDARFTEPWLANLTAALSGRTPDFLIIQHLEPDHSGSIAAFMEAYPQAQIVASAMGFKFMKQFYGTDYPDRQIVASEGFTLSLGAHTLQFFGAPMVHWPEVLVTYETSQQVLFSADAFGKFGALDVEEDWACEARRYYFGIVGKHGMQVQTLLKKLEAFPLSVICPLHGPVLNENLDYYLNLYKTWSSYGVESDGVFIAYTSVYGHTKEAAQLLAAELEALGCPKVVLTDLARCDMAEAVEDAFRYGKLALATTTYNMELFPFMRDFLSHLAERSFQNRRVAFIENGTWAPVAAKLMREQLASCRDLTFTDTSLRIVSALTEENKETIKIMAKELL